MALFATHEETKFGVGDTIRVSQEIAEGEKTRIQVFEGLVIRISRKNSLSSTITVRRVANGYRVEKTYLLHSPLVVKVEVTKRSKVRRNYLTYMRQRTGKAARLTGVKFDQERVNTVSEPKVEEAPKQSAEKTEENSESIESKK